MAQYLVVQNNKVVDEYVSDSKKGGAKEAAFEALNQGFADEKDQVEVYTVTRKVTFAVEIVSQLTELD